MDETEPTKYISFYSTEYDHHNDNYYFDWLTCESNLSRVSSRERVLQLQVMLMMMVEWKLDGFIKMLSIHNFLNAPTP